uniref:substrate-binding periplasmic protein n=1 Tax=Marinobacterium profundum TaxID=1714300 RepID=UPI000832FBED|nr:transporter substrate-binding domain-containing protein [Marinobacterium profundum]
MNTINLVADPFPPYQYMDINGQLAGADYEIIVNAFLRVDIAVNVKLYPWGECDSKVRAGEVDGAFQVQRSSEREKYFAFSNTLRESETTLYVSRKYGDKYLGIKSFDSLAGPIGLLKGYCYGDSLGQSILEKSLRFESTIDLIEAIENGKIDGGVMDCGVYNFLVSHHNHMPLLKIYDLLFKRPLSLMVANSKSGIVENFNRGLEAIKCDGLYHTILEKYQVSQ